MDAFVDYKKVVVAHSNQGKGSYRTKLEGRHLNIKMLIFMANA